MNTLLGGAIAVLMVVAICGIIVVTEQALEYMWKRENKVAAIFFSIFVFLMVSFFFGLLIDPVRW